MPTLLGKPAKHNLITSQIKTLVIYSMKIIGIKLNGEQVVIAENQTIIRGERTVARLNREIDAQLQVNPSLVKYDSYKLAEDDYILNSFVFTYAH